jgi:hypothetical protein
MLRLLSIVASVPGNFLTFSLIRKICIGLQEKQSPLEKKVIAAPSETILQFPQFVFYVLDKVNYVQTFSPLRLVLHPILYVRFFPGKYLSIIKF